MTVTYKRGEFISYAARGFFFPFISLDRSVWHVHIYRPTLMLTMMEGEKSWLHALPDCATTIARRVRPHTFSCVKFYTYIIRKHCIHSAFNFLFIIFLLPSPGDSPRRTLGMFGPHHDQKYEFFISVFFVIVSGRKRKKIKKSKNGAGMERLKAGAQILF